MFTSFRITVLFVVIILLASCSVSRNIQQLADKNLFNDSVLADAHTGISVFDAELNKFIYNYQSDKYFVPASNTKIISLYAGMKYFTDSLVGLRYKKTADTLFIIPSGDPSFLHPDFSSQPVFDFLKKQSGPIAITTNNWKARALGEGWMWDDYNDTYMTERSPFPVYGNVIRWIQVRDSGSIAAMAREEAFIYSEPDISWKVSFSGDTAAQIFSVQRFLTENRFFITQGKEVSAERKVPFITNGLQSALELLKDSLGKTIDPTSTIIRSDGIIHSQPSDSLFKIMMHRSDNFYAEQVLLMAANEKSGAMDDRQMIQYLLNNDLQGFPQAPRWADGSGLSRYNLFTPQDFIWVLHKMKNEFGMERLKTIFPTGGTGTLTNYYKKDSAFIYAKTGSMSGVLSLSGYLYTKSGKLLIFSVLVNNHRQPARMIRRKLELFLHGLRAKY
ncbi:D-alanyl-D-alanine carboxypeptidase [Agriterribacter sp.]|uniref:D-alanyl-D-alanine carboxypeptidase/D-alanyl-D-alanine-endopeptidase n=1 Tax=Agriterribacter sp. TaxID=2821509 RepID=UPI002B5E761E|nr:D-alanyl-D-alanine carboxypeptidase [Agriterribacter sp.]HRP57845.1 D-alanyl-D-alanine carboxypeptidase [Agriterribacter sp.]